MHWQIEVGGEDVFFSFLSAPAHLESMSIEPAEVVVNCYSKLGYTESPAILALNQIDSHAG